MCCAPLIAPTFAAKIYSEALNLTIIAIRGTDLGRLSDFVEDMKLWTEPFAFMLLAAVFPTVRFWPDDIKLTLIQWLQETLNFFGMKQEAEYYKVLVKRVNVSPPTSLTTAFHL